MNVSDVQGTHIKLLGTAVYFISLEEHGPMRRVEAVVAEKLHGDEIIINVSKLIDMGICPKNWPAPNKETFEAGVKGMDVWECAIDGKVKQVQAAERLPKCFGKFIFRRRRSYKNI